MIFTPPNSKCKFYYPTAFGYRCVLIGIEDWRIRKNRLLDYCNNGGRGCPILASYLSKVGNNAGNRKNKRIYSKLM